MLTDLYIARPTSPPIRDITIGQLLKIATDTTLDKVQWLHTGDHCSTDHRDYDTFENQPKEIIVRGSDSTNPTKNLLPADS